MKEGGQLTGFCEMTLRVCGLRFQRQADVSEPNHL